MTENLIRRSCRGSQLSTRKWCRQLQEQGREITQHKPRFFLPPVPVLGDINETNLLHHALGIGIGFLLTLIIIQTIRYLTDMNPLSPRSNSIGYDDRTCRTFSAVQPPTQKKRGHRCAHRLGLCQVVRSLKSSNRDRGKSMEMSLPSWRCAMCHWLIPLQKIKYLKPLQKHCIGDCLACEQNCWSCPFPHPTSSCPSLMHEI